MCIFLKRKKITFSIIKHLTIQIELTILYRYFLSKKYMHLFQDVVNMNLLGYKIYHDPGSNVVKHM